MTNNYLIKVISPRKFWLSKVLILEEENFFPSKNISFVIAASSVISSPLTTPILFKRELTVKTGVNLI